MAGHWCKHLVVTSKRLANLTRSSGLTLPEMMYVICINITSHTWIQALPGESHPLPQNPFMGICEVPPQIS